MDLPICCLSGLLPDNGQASPMRHIILVVRWIHSLSRPTASQWALDSSNLRAVASRSR